MATKIQLKRGLDTKFNAIALSAGEPAFITDTGKLYVGDGSSKVLINPINKPPAISTTTSYIKVNVNEYGQVVTGSPLLATDIPKITASQVTGLGTAAFKNAGTSVGDVPVLDTLGKLSSSVLPPLAITDTFIVSSESEMMALVADVGDIAIRTDITKTFILKTLPTTELANWVELLKPTDSVLSVNGKTGVVSLSALHLDMTGYVKAVTSSSISPTDSIASAIGKVERGLDSYAPLLSPELTGIPTAPTPAKTDNTTAIATTSFVQTVIANIDGGTF